MTRMAKAVKKPTGQHKRQPTTIPETEIRAMFDFWYEHDRNVTQTALHFKRPRLTVYNFASKYGWDARANKISEKFNQAMDRKILQSKISNVTIARRMLAKEAGVYFAKERKGTGNPFVLVSLIRYIDDVEGNMPHEGGNTLNLFNFGELPDDERNRVHRNLQGLFAGAGVSGRL